MNKEEYEQYRQTPHWRLTRQQHVAEHPNCVVCRITGDWTVIDVHHRHYNTLWNEQPEDLATLCRRHHEMQHSPECEHCGHAKWRNLLIWHEGSGLRAKVCCRICASHELDGISFEKALETADERGNI